MTSLRAYAALVRAPAALSVPGDPLVGAAAAGRPFGPAVAGLAASSVCLYWGGMALNDYADRAVDAVERPDRPIPSGRVRPRQALALATGLTCAGLAAAGAAGGRRSLAVAVPLAATVWAYDLGLKRHPIAGSAAMALARGLDVQLGAGYGSLRSAAPAASVIGAHTLVVSALGRHEVRGAGFELLAPTLAATAGVAALAGAGRTPPRHPVLTAGMLGLYLAGFAGAQAWAGDRDPVRLQQAVEAGIGALLPLQAACATRAGALRVAVPLLAGAPLARALFRKVTPT